MTLTVIVMCLFKEAIIVGLLQILFLALINPLTPKLWGVIILQPN